jgi:hypothetical protein
LTEVGEALGDRFDVHASPSFLVFDARGRLVHTQRGTVPGTRVRALVSGAE